MKRILLCMIILFASANIWSQTITETGGWLESAFVKWTAPAGGADSYNVYYNGTVKIDNQLIRSYGSYYRADILGLAAGSYTITIKPVVSGVEQAGVTTNPINVIAQDRNGFAFEGGHIPGGYNIDGTLKTNAMVIYVTRYTKNTVSLNVTGATTNPCVGLQNILDGYKKGKETRPLVVRLVGNITDLISTFYPDPNTVYGGDVVIENKIGAAGPITFEGVGSDAVVNGWGIRVKNSSNIEIRNLGFMLTNADEGDNVGLQQANDHVWVHNCDMFYGAANGDADQVKGDGALDAKGSTYITFSYNHFWDSGKCNLLGLSEGTTIGLYITYHHNWYDHSDSRHPRVRFYSAHVYNNYYDGNSKYGAGSTMGSSVFMEGNFFRNCKYPMLTAMQGTDLLTGVEGTFSAEDGGTIKAFNNSISGAYRYMPYNASNNPIEFDAIEVTTRNETIPSSITSKKGTNIYNNFDTDAALYIKDLTIDTPAEAKDKTVLYAGRVSGGDLKYTFNNAVDDASSDVNTALKSALTNYTTKMVSIQGEVIPPGNQNLTVTTNNNDQSVYPGSAISNIVFTWGGDAIDANATELPNGVIATKNTTAKTLTLSGIPTETKVYTVTTNGDAGNPTTQSGTITVLPPSSQTLTLTSNNNSNQTINLGAAITPIVLTWSGDAEDANVSTLPTGIIAVKDTTGKTITISGTPTATGAINFTVTTSGSTGTPVALSGTITVNAAPVGDVIHNYTLSGPTSSFYTFAGSEKSGPVATTYNNLSLTRAHKMDSTGKVTYTTTAVSTLTLVILPRTSATIKLNNTVYSIPTNGVIVIENVPAGLNTIVQGSGESHLYYLKTSYSTLGLGDNNVKTPKLTVYPNPVTDQLNFSNVANQKIENVTIYSITGAVVKTISNPSESIDVSTLRTGNYLVKVTTDQGTFTQKIIKK